MKRAKITAAQVVKAVEALNHPAVGFEYIPRSNGNTTVPRFKVWLVALDGRKVNELRTDVPSVALRTVQNIVYVTNQLGRQK